MKELTQKDLVLFEHIAGASQSVLKKILGDYLKKIYKSENIIETEEYICAKGNIPIALVSHLDTVFKVVPTEIYYDKHKGVLWSPQGLGADDRAGVFAILKIINSGLRPHVIFTTDEEIGGIGASILGMDGCPFEDLRFMIELDRRGDMDCVFYDCDNKAFIKYIEKFGFIENFGSFSDICFLSPEWGIAAVNLSIGYKNEHSVSETLHVGSLFSTIDKVKTILSQPIDDIPEFEFVPAINFYDWTKNLYPTYSTDIDYVCSICGQDFPEKDVVVAISSDGEDYNIFCKQCKPGIIECCAICGEYFEIDPYDPTLKICKSCYDEVIKNA